MIMVVSVNLKKCSKCGTGKTLDEFSPNGLGKVKSACKECRRAAAAAARKPAVKPTPPPAAPAVLGVPDIEAKAPVRKPAGKKVPAKKVIVAKKTTAAGRKPVIKPAGVAVTPAARKKAAVKPVARKKPAGVVGVSVAPKKAAPAKRKPAPPRPTKPNLVSAATPVVSAPIADTLVIEIPPVTVVPVNSTEETIVIEFPAFRLNEIVYQSKDVSFGIGIISACVEMCVTAADVVSGIYTRVVKRLTGNGKRRNNKTRSR
jgi:hypothetical protein